MWQKVKKKKYVSLYNFFKELYKKTINDLFSVYTQYRTT